MSRLLMEVAQRRQRQQPLAVLALTHPLPVIPYLPVKKLLHVITMCQTSVWMEMGMASLVTVFQPMQIPSHHLNSLLYIG